MNTAVRVAAQRDRRPWWRIWWDQHQKAKRQRTPQACTASRGHLKVSLGSGENDEVISIELAGAEGVRGGKGNTGDGRAKSDSETANQKIEKKGEKEFCLA